MNRGPIPRSLARDFAEDFPNACFAKPPAGDDAPRLCSRIGVPSLLVITAHDHRRLGVALARVELQQPGLATVFEHDVPLFGEGGVPWEGRMGVSQ